MNTAYRAEMSSPTTDTGQGQTKSSADAGSACVVAAQAETGWLNDKQPSPRLNGSGKDSCDPLVDGGAGVQTGGSTDSGSSAVDSQGLLSGRSSFRPVVPRQTDAEGEPQQHQQHQPSVFPVLPSEPEPAYASVAVNGAACAVEVKADGAAATAAAPEALPLQLLPHMLLRPSQPRQPITPEMAPESSSNSTVACTTAARDTTFAAVPDPHAPLPAALKPTPSAFSNARRPSPDTHCTMPAALEPRANGLSVPQQLLVAQQQEPPQQPPLNVSPHMQLQSQLLLNTLRSRMAAQGGVAAAARMAAPPMPPVPSIPPPVPVAVAVAEPLAPSLPAGDLPLGQAAAAAGSGTAATATATAPPAPLSTTTATPPAPVTNTSAPQQAAPWGLGDAPGAPQPALQGLGLGAMPTAPPAAPDPAAPACGPSSQAPAAAMVSPQPPPQADIGTLLAQARLLSASLLPYLQYTGLHAQQLRTAPAGADPAAAAAAATAAGLAPAAAPPILPAAAVGVAPGAGPLPAGLLATLGPGILSPTLLAGLGPGTLPPGLLGGLGQGGAIPGLVGALGLGSLPAGLLAGLGPLALPPCLLAGAGSGALPPGILSAAGSGALPSGILPGAGPGALSSVMLPGPGSAVLPAGAGSGALPPSVLASASSGALPAGLGAGAPVAVAVPEAAPLGSGSLGQGPALGPGPAGLVTEPPQNGAVSRTELGPRSGSGALRAEDVKGAVRAAEAAKGASTRTNGVAAAVKAEEEENASGRDRDGMEQDATEDGAAAKGPSPAHGQSPGQASPTSDSQPQGLRVSKRIRKKPRLSLYSDDDGDADEAAPATAAAARVRSRSGGGGGGASGAAAAAAAAAAGGGAAPAGGLHGLLVLALAAAADDPKPGGGGPGAAREDDDDDSVEDHGGKRAAGHGSAQHGRGAGRGGAAARGRGGASPIAPPAAAAALPAATLRAPFVTSRNRAPAAAAAAAAAAAGAPMARGVVSPAVLEEITAQNISMFFDQPARTVARNLGVSLSFFKKRCRLLGIARWPQRKLHSLDRAAQAVREDISLTIFEREELLALIETNKADIRANPAAPFSPRINALRQAQYKQRAPTGAKWKRVDRPRGRRGGSETSSGDEDGLDDGLGGASGSGGVGGSGGGLECGDVMGDEMDEDGDGVGYEGGQGGGGRGGVERLAGQQRRAEVV